MRETDLAWAAGFIDGEGYIGIPRRTNKWTRKADGLVFTYDYHVLVISVGQLSIQPLLKLKEMFGGSITLTKNLRVNQHDTHTWTVSSRAAALCLESVLPFLLVKREQAKIALDYRKYISETPRRVKRRSEETNKEIIAISRALKAQREFEKGVRNGSEVSSPN